MTVLSSSSALNATSTSLVVTLVTDTPSTVVIEYPFPDPLGRAQGAYTTVCVTEATALLGQTEAVGSDATVADDSMSVNG